MARTAPGGDEQIGRCLAQNWERSEPTTASGVGLRGLNAPPERDEQIGERWAENWERSDPAHWSPILFEVNISGLATFVDGEPSFD